MSTIPSQPEASETLELVAYLDGELSAEACRRVEQRLAEDAGYRRQLSDLEQAWTALDALPPTKVDDDFARTTIEMVAIAAERDVSEKSAAQAATGRRKMYWLTAAGGAAAVLAFAAARLLVPDPNNLLMRDLPVIVELDVLTQIEDIEYLRGLAKLDLKPLDDGSGDSDGVAAQIAALNDVRSRRDRRAWLERLPAGDKAELAAKFDRFMKLSPALEAQDRLRRLERDIATAPDRAELQLALANYAVWIQRRPPGEQLELRELPTAERLRRVESWLRRGDRTADWQLSPEDENALQDAVLEFVAERRPAFIEQVRRRGDRELERRIAQHPTAIVALMIIGGEMRDDDTRRRLQEQLTARLSPEAQEHLDDLPGRQRRWQLWRWIDKALRPKLGPKQLEHYFTDELNNNQREYLLSLPVAEMEEQLRQMYIRSQVGLRDGDWGGGFGRPGQFGPGGGPDWNRGRGPGERDRRGGPRRDFDGERFERGPFPRRPGGPPHGPPPVGPPPNGGHWRPPPDRPPNEGSPPGEAI